MPWIEYEREELYERVWTTPMTQIAGEENISDRGLAKICKKLDVPRPPRGYWAKVAAGKKPQKTRLPKWKSGTPMVHKRWMDDVRDKERSDAADKLLAANESLDEIVVSDELVDPHPLLAKCLKKLRTKKPRPLTRTARLDVQVETPEARERAFCIMDVLLKALEAREIEVEVTKPNPNEHKSVASETLACVMGISVAFGLDEETDSVKTTQQTEIGEMLGMAPKARYHRIPNGQLALRIRTNTYFRSGLRKTWADGKKQRVEDCLQDFINGLIQTAEYICERNKLREQERLEKLAREHVFAEAQRRKEHQKMMREDLEQRVVAMQKAQAIRELIMTMQRRHDVSETRSDWTDWARGVADKLEAEAFERDLPTTQLPGQLTED